MDLKLHDYQQAAVQYIIDHPRCGLFLDMGLGKTVITLTAIRELMRNRLEVGRVLVIAPLRVARETWPQELDKWSHLSDLTYTSLCDKSPLKRIQALEEDVDITIINRELVPWLMESAVWRWDMIVVDELSSFKNRSSMRFRALKKALPFCDRVVGLTGTPAPNGLLDLWAQIYVLDSGERLGRFWTPYVTTYFDRNPYNIYDLKPKLGAEELILDKIKDITMSMSAVDHLDMPERVELEEKVKLSETERAHYRTLANEFYLQLPEGDIDAQSAGVLSNKLLQMANGRVYADEQSVVTVHNRKLDALESLIESAQGQPVLVLYWYQHDLDAIRSRFDVRQLSTSRDIRAWCEGKIPIAVANPASCGHGLNLQSGGSIIIWYGLTWSLELYEQANARLWRQGQKNRVTIYRIVTENTIDERVLEALHRKAYTQQNVIDAVRAELGERITRNELND